MGVRWGRSLSSWIPNIKALCGSLVSSLAPPPSGVDSCLSPQSPVRKGKRAWSVEEEGTAPEAEDVWAVETLCGLKMKLKRRRVSAVLPEHHEVFSRLLGRKGPWGGPSNPILLLKKEEPSSDYTFPVEENSL